MTKQEIFSEIILPVIGLTIAVIGLGFFFSILEMIL